ncbi:MAG: radical SAM protein [Clostridia bacterium]|nr:radical SAM protein [Clostridia bacterium]
MDFHNCTLCPRECGADRTVMPGACGGKDRLRIARAALHFGEEPCITGERGSGTVFFSGCALRCRFCQNQSISQGEVGKDISQTRLSEIFLELQDQGAENINLVTPSHFAPLVAASLRSIKNDLQIPVVCNCGGYESEEILHCFEGLVDVYLPDLKYFSSDRSFRYSDVENYFEVASRALKRMYGQTGDCIFSERGILQKGLLIRHLVLPNGKADSIALLRWISQEFPLSSVRISLMRQYTPCGDLSPCPELNRRLFSLEYSAVLREATKLRLVGYSQGRDCDNFSMTPDFDLSGV